MDASLQALPDDIDALRAVALMALAELAVAKAKAADDQALIARQELHIAGDVSARHKKKKSRDGRCRAVGSEADGKHGFEMPTAKVVREVAIGEALSVGELAHPRTD